MPIKPTSIYTTYHTSDFFSLAIKPGKSQTKLIMKLNHETVNTRALPETYALLKIHLPTVLRSKCFNDNNYPFYKEVLRTEIGHLFEHILIENLCLLKVDRGCDDAEFSGVTKWNWVLHPRGTFHITVSAGEDDIAIFAEAMEKSIQLVTQILFSGIPDIVQPTVPLHIDQTANIVPAVLPAFESPIN